MPNLDGTEIESIINQDLMSPVGITVDRIRKRIYFTDRYANVIKSSDYNGQNIEVVLDKVVYPTDIAIDSKDFRMYWTSRGEGKILRARLDGGEVETLVSNVKQPIGIALDMKSQKVYYSSVNLLHGRVFCCDFVGGNVTKIALWGIPLGLALRIDE